MCGTCKSFVHLVYGMYVLLVDKNKALEYMCIACKKDEKMDHILESQADIKQPSRSAWENGLQRSYLKISNKLEMWSGPALDRNRLQLVLHWPHQRFKINRFDKISLSATS